MEPRGLDMLSGVNELDDRVFGTAINEGYVPAFLEDYDHNYDTVECDENFEGMIFMSNRQTKKECFNRELFGLPISQASVVKRVKPGMKLFLFEYERRQLYGVFEATSSGAFNIERNAFKTSGGSFPAQVRIKTVWECNPLSEEDFRDAIYENYYTPKKFHFYLSQKQVLELIRLFSSRKIESRVLEGADCFGSNEDLREKLDRQHQTTMLLQEVRNKMTARESDYTNVEEDEIVYEKDCSAGHILADVLDSQERIALYSSEQPSFSTSFEQRLALQSAQERNISTNCEQTFAMHSAQHCNLFSGCGQRVALHSAQQPNVSSGVEQIHALHSVQQPIFSSGFEQGLAVYSLQQPNVSSSVDMSNSVFQPSYMRGYPSSEENYLGSRDAFTKGYPSSEENYLGSRDAFTKGYPSSEENYLGSRDAFTNSIKMSEEMDSTNGRDLYIPSNYRHSDSLYFNESVGPHVPLSLNSMHGTHAIPIDGRQWFERQELSQVPLNQSPVNDNNGSRFSHMDNFLDDLHSKVMEQPERPVLGPTAAMSSFRSDNSTQKGSVFTRLRRVPQTEVSHDKDHEDMMRHSHVAKSGVQQYLQKLPRSLAKKPEILGGPHDSRLDIDVRDRQISNDGIAINYKQRSKVNNAGKESNKRVDTQTKSVHNSLDIEVTDEETVNDGMVINFKRRSDTCKAIKESNLQVESQTKSIDGEPNSHRQKRRKLIRPEFNNPMISEANFLPVSVPESIEICHVETKILTQPENIPSTVPSSNTFVSRSVVDLLDSECDPESGRKCPVESKKSTQPENDASANSIFVMECPVESKTLTQPENGATANYIVIRECHVESKELTQPENDGSADSIVTRECPVESKNSEQSENAACPKSIDTSVVDHVGISVPCPNAIVTSVVDLVRISIPESVEEYPVENKILAQTEKVVSRNSNANENAASPVDSSAISIQEMPIANPMDAEER